MVDLASSVRFQTPGRVLVIGLIERTQSNLPPPVDWSADGEQKSDSSNERYNNVTHGDPEEGSSLGHKPRNDLVINRKQCRLA